MMKLSSAAWQRFIQDDDAVREAEADFSSMLVSLLQHPDICEGLLGLDHPPERVQHPSLMELWEAPSGQDRSDMVQEAVLNGLK